MHRQRRRRLDAATAGTNRRGALTTLSLALLVALLAGLAPLAALGLGLVAGALVLWRACALFARRAGGSRFRA